LEMGGYGRRRVEDYFTPRRLVDDVEQVYRHMLGLESESPSSGDEFVSSLQLNLPPSGGADASTV
jgi:hypothetical protein